MGVFQQQISGGDTQFAPQAAVQDDSASKLLGFAGEQAVEANRGYRDAEFEGEAREAIEGRILKAYSQFAGGENVELDAFSAELGKYKEGYKQGALTNSDMSVRVENARRKAINLMPGRVQEINTLSQQTLGQYKAQLDQIDAQEKAQATQNAWADKELRKEAMKSGVPTEIALYAPTSELIGNPEHSRLLEISSNARQQEQIVGIANSQDALTTRQSRQAGSQIAFSTSASMHGTLLNIASGIMQDNVTDLKTLPVEVRARVEAQARTLYAEQNNMNKTRLSTSGWTGYNDHADSIIAQLDNEMLYMNGGIENAAYESASAGAIAKAEVNILSIPGNPERKVALDWMSKNALPTEARSLAGPFVQSVDTMINGSGPITFSSPEVVRDAIKVTTSVAKNPNIDAQGQEGIDQYLQNLSVGVTKITDPNSLKDVLQDLANPQKSAIYSQSAGSVTATLDYIVSSQGANLIKHMQANGLGIERQGNCFVFTGGGLSTRRKATRIWSPVIKNMEYVNDNVAPSSSFGRLSEILQLNPAEQQQQQPEGDDLSAQFEQEVIRIADQPDSTNAEKDAQLKVLIDQFKEKGFDVKGGGSYG